MSVLGDRADFFEGEEYEPGEDGQAGFLENHVQRLHKFITDHAEDDEELHYRLTDLYQAVDRAYSIGRHSVLDANAPLEKTFEAAKKNTDQYRSKSKRPQKDEFLAKSRECKRAGMNKTKTREGLASFYGVSFNTVKKLGKTFWPTLGWPIPGLLSLVKHRTHSRFVWSNE